MRDLESLRSVFKDKIFRIPDYQRGYAWTKKQLADFWEDIYNLPQDRYHYTGLLSLKEVTRDEYLTWQEERWLIEKRGVKPFYIVDGQQRLTTFIIFINEIMNLVEKVNLDNGKTHEKVYLNSFLLKEIEEDYISIVKPPDGIIRTYKFGYEKDNPSFQYLRYKIFDENFAGNIEETFYTLNLENAKNFFKENLQEAFEEGGVDLVEELFRKTTQSLMFNIHYIQEDFDVFVAFETMNNRGKKLSNLELLKNRLIYLTTLYNDNELDVDAKYILRKKINDSWKEVYFQLGRNKTNPLSDNDFLVGHWITYFEYTNQKGQAYIEHLLEKTFTSQNVFEKKNIKESSLIVIEEIKSELDEAEDELSVNNQEDKLFGQARLSPLEIESYVGSLKETARHWYNTFNPINNQDLTKEESRWIERINRIGMAYFRPLITASFLAKDAKPEDRIKLFKEIERFIFVAFRLGRAFSTYRNNEFHKLTRQLAAGDKSIDDICTILNERLLPWIKEDGVFNYQSFKTYVDRLFTNNNGFYSWNAIRYFLYEYEMEKVESYGIEKIDWAVFTRQEKDKVSIEHILPQTADNDYWQKYFGRYSSQQLHFLTNSLGNLLPLSKSVNSRLQNDSFPDKKKPKGNNRRGYANGSYSEIEVSQYRYWTASSIQKRGMHLLAFMERRWNLKFESDEAKKDLLFLNFVK